MSSPYDRRFNAVKVRRIVNIGKAVPVRELPDLSRELLRSREHAMKPRVVPPAERRVGAAYILARRKFNQLGRDEEDESDDDSHEDLEASASMQSAQQEDGTDPLLAAVAAGNEAGVLSQLDALLEGFPAGQHRNWGDVMFLGLQEWHLRIGQEYDAEGEEVFETEDEENSDVDHTSSAKSGGPSGSATAAASRRTSRVTLVGEQHGSVVPSARSSRKSSLRGATLQDAASRTGQPHIPHPPKTSGDRLSPPPAPVATSKFSVIPNQQSYLQQQQQQKQSVEIDEEELERRRLEEQKRVAAEKLADDNQYVADLMLALVDATRVHSLVVHHSQLTRQQLYAFCYRGFMKTSARIVKLALTFCDLRGEMLAPICLSMYYLSHIRVLDLSNNSLEGSSLVFLERTLGDNGDDFPHLESLVLAGNPLGEVGFSHILPIMSANKNIKRYNLSFCQFHDSGMLKIASLLPSLHHIQYLYLDGISVSQQAGLVLLDAVASNKSLIKLSLRFVSACISKNYQARLANFMKRNYQLFMQRKMATEEMTKSVHRHKDGGGEGGGTTSPGEKGAGVSEGDVFQALDDEMDELSVFSGGGALKVGYKKYTTNEPSRFMGGGSRSETSSNVL